MVWRKIKSATWDLQAILFCEARRQIFATWMENSRYNVHGAVDEAALSYKCKGFLMSCFNLRPAYPQFTPAQPTFDLKVMDEVNCFRTKTELLRVIRIESRLDTITSGRIKWQRDQLPLGGTKIKKEWTKIKAFTDSRILKVTSEEINILRMCSHRFDSGSDNFHAD